MANKITQLVNKDGDNLYPLAGGILSDSVATDMIQDGAVTSDKIDSATIVNSNIADNTITLDKLKMPKITIAGVDGNQQNSVYKITFDPNVEPYTIFVGTVYVRHNMPSTFRITVGATTGVISSAVFTDSTNFSATTSGNTVTVTYTGGQWSMFYLAYMEYKATMGMTVTRS